MVEKSKKVLDKKDTKVKKISNNKKRVKKEIKTEEPKKEIEVTKIRNLGKKSLKEVLDKVEEMGLKFHE